MAQWLVFGIDSQISSIHAYSHRRPEPVSVNDSHNKVIANGAHTKMHARISHSGDDSSYRLKFRLNAVSLHHTVAVRHWDRFRLTLFCVCSHWMYSIAYRWRKWPVEGDWRCLQATVIYCWTMHECRQRVRVNTRLWFWLTVNEFVQCPRSILDFCIAVHYDIVMYIIFKSLCHCTIISAATQSQRRVFSVHVKIAQHHSQTALALLSQFACGLDWHQNNANCVQAARDRDRCWAHSFVYRNMYMEWWHTQMNVCQCGDLVNCDTFSISIWTKCFVALPPWTWRNFEQFLFSSNTSRSA